MQRQAPACLCTLLAELQCVTKYSFVLYFYIIIVSYVAKKWSANADKYDRIWKRRGECL